MVLYHFVVIDWLVDEQMHEWTNRWLENIMPLPASTIYCKNRTLSTEK